MSGWQRSTRKSTHEHAAGIAEAAAGGIESCPRRLRRAGSVTDFVPTRLPGRPVGGSVATGGLQVELDALRQRQRVGVVYRVGQARSEEHTSELQSLMRISYAVFCSTKKKHTSTSQHYSHLLSNRMN